MANESYFWFEDYDKMKYIYFDNHKYQLKTCRKRIAALMDLVLNTHSAK